MRAFAACSPTSSSTGAEARELHSLLLLVSATETARPMGRDITMARPAAASVPAPTQNTGWVLINTKRQLGSSTALPRHRITRLNVASREVDRLNPSST